MSWLFILDDENDEGSLGSLPDLAERTLFSIHEVAFGGVRGSVPDGSAHDNLAQALRTIRTDIGASLTPAWRRRFSHNVTNYLLLTAAADVVCWTNDLLTLDKEMAHDDTHNLVLVVQGCRGGSLQNAIDAVTRLANARVQDFLDAEATLDGLLNQLRYSTDQRATVGRCIAMLRSWMRGHVDWGTQTRRYWQRDGIWSDDQVVL